MSNEVLKNDTSMTLDWADVSGAVQYELDISLYPDFSVIQQNFAPVSSTQAFTDIGANNQKRWWRWRSYTGITPSRWYEVGSYWLNTGFSGDLLLSNNQWALVNPSSITDKFVLTTFPVYTVVPQMFERIRERNRLGNLLSEFITIKDLITFSFDESRFMSHAQMNELIRFHRQVKTFFLTTYKHNGTDYVPHVWKVQFEADPEMTMLAAGRQDLFIGDLVFMEV